MTSMFDYDDNLNTVFNAKTAGKSLVAAKHEVLGKTGEFLFLAHSDREFALRCQMVEKDLESAALRKMATTSDSKAKLVRALHEEWKIRHANCFDCRMEPKTAAPYQFDAIPGKDAQEHLSSGLGPDVTKLLLQKLSGNPRATGDTPAGAWAILRKGDGDKAHLTLARILPGEDGRALQSHFTCNGSSLPGCNSANGCGEHHFGIQEVKLGLKKIDKGTFALPQIDNQALLGQYSDVTPGENFGFVPGSRLHILSQDNQDVINNFLNEHARANGYAVKVGKKSYHPALAPVPMGELVTARRSDTPSEKGKSYTGIQVGTSLIPCSSTYGLRDQSISGRRTKSSEQQCKGNPDPLNPVASGCGHVHPIIHSVRSKQSKGNSPEINGFEEGLYVPAESRLTRTGQMFVPGSQASYDAARSLSARAGNPGAPGAPGSSGSGTGRRVLPEDFDIGDLGL